MAVCWERWNRRKNIMTGEVDYLEPHGDGKSFYNIGSITPEKR